MASNNTHYENLIEKLKFGRSLESVQSSLLENDDKPKVIARFVNQVARNLYEHTYKNYEFLPNDNDEDEQIEDKTLVERCPMKIINDFASLIKLDESKSMIANNMNILNRSTIDYLQSWAFRAEIDGNFIQMQRIMYQTTIILCIIELIEASNDDRAKSVEIFFDKMANQQKYKQQFLRKYNRLHDSVRDSAEHNSRNPPEESAEKEERKGLDQDELDVGEVIKSLPTVLLECFQSRNVTQLGEVLSKMMAEEAAEYIDRCLKAGLSVPDMKDAANNDGEEMGTENMTD